MSSLLSSLFKPNTCNTMKTDSFRNRRVLKQVHPGGFAEIHKNPVCAAEVMKKNPRHFITHPDVFRFPWTGIRPQAILKPGEVFFIVPYFTVYRLLKKCKSLIQASLLQQQCHVLPCNDEICPAGSWTEQEVTWANDDVLIHFPPEGDSLESSVDIRQDFHLLLEKQSPPVSYARTKVDCKFEDADAIFPKELVYSNIEQILEKCLDEQSSGKAHFEVKTKQHFDNSLKKLYPTKYSPVISGNKNHRNESISSFSSESTLSDAEFVVPSPKDDNEGLDISSSQEKKTLKSCLKKNNFAKAHNFRVKFVLPEST